MSNLKFDKVKIKAKPSKHPAVNTVAPTAHALPLVAAAPVKPNVSKALQAPAEVQAKNVDMAVEIQADKEVRVQRLNQSLDRSQLNYSFDKPSSTLSVKVVNKQSGEFIRQLDFKGFQAMAYSTHGYKGHLVDNAA